MLKFIVGLLAISSLSYASLPSGCDVIELKKPSFELQAKLNQLFYMKNTHPDNIYLVGTKPNLTIKISPQKWAILLVAANEKNNFFCIESKPGSEQRVACGDVVQICQLSKAKIADKFKETSWLIKDESLDQASENLHIKHVLVN